MYRAGTDADCLGHHRRRPMGDLTRRIAQRLRHRLLVQRSRQRRDARSSGLVVQQPVDPLRHETLLPAPYGDLALAGLPHDRVGPDAICRQQHDACAPHMLLSAVPIRDDRLQMRTIGAAHFNRDPLAHARSPSLAEHTLVRDSYVRFNPLAGRLEFFADQAGLAEPARFKAYVAALRKVEWVVYAKRPFGGPGAMLAYLSRY